MRFRVVIFVVSLLLGFVGKQTLAENDHQPIDPTEIFTNQIEVVETLPTLSYDNQVRLLWYFNPATKTWSSYPYPPELDEMQDYRPLADSTYLLSDDYYIGIAEAIWEKVWLFDPTTGTINRPPKVCNLVQALPGEGQWRLTTLEDGLFHLCNTETGKFSEALPDDLQSRLSPVCPGGPPVAGVPVISPDKHWVVFHDCPQVAMTEWPESVQYSIYAYEIETGHLNDLGQLADAQFLEVDSWADQHTFIVRGGEIGTNRYHQIYTANVMQPESITLIASTLQFDATYSSEPPQIFWFHDEKQSVVLYRYEVSTQERSDLLHQECAYNQYSFCYPTEIVPSTGNLIAFLVGNGFGRPISIIDTETGDSVYQTIGDQLIWIRSQGFVFDKLQDSHWSLYRVDINEGNVVETELSEGVFYGYPPRLSDDKRFVLLQKSLEPSADNIAVYDLATQAEMSIFSTSLDDNSYFADVDWAQSGLLHVTISLKQCSSFCERYEWLVRLN